MKNKKKNPHPNKGGEAKGEEEEEIRPIELYSHQRVRPFLLFNHNNNSNKNIKETSKQLTAGGDFTGGGRSFFSFFPFFFFSLLVHL
jgi:hypothetical protein